MAVQIIRSKEYEPPKAVSELGDKLRQAFLDMHMQKQQEEEMALRQAAEARRAQQDAAIQKQMQMENENAVFDRAVKIRDFLTGKPAPEQPLPEGQAGPPAPPAQVQLPELSLGGQTLSPAQPYQPLSPGEFAAKQIEAVKQKEQITGDSLEVTPEMHAALDGHPQGKLIQTMFPVGSRVSRETASKIMEALKPAPHKLQGFAPGSQIRDEQGNIVGSVPPKEDSATPRVLSPDGVALQSYGIKEREAIRKQATESNIPVFASGKHMELGNTAKEIYRDAARLDELMKLSEVKAAIGIKGIFTRWKGGFVDLPPDVTEALQLTNALSDTELRRRSGAQINEQEMQRILKFATDPSKPVQHNLTAIAHLTKTSKNVYKALAGGYDLSTGGYGSAPGPTEPKRPKILSVTKVAE